MERKYISKLGYKELTDLISETKNLLILSLPNIYDELCQSILEYGKNIKNVKIIIDNSENCYRYGYGDIKAVENLRNSGFQIYDLTGNMVSFIICDNIGYYIFSQSRIFSDLDDVSFNSVIIDPISIIRLKNHYFPPDNNKDKENIENELIESVNKIKDYLKETSTDIKKEQTVKLNNLNPENLNIVKEKLTIDPPVHPDFQRKIKTYTSKIQFMELRFNGANLQNKELDIPPKILPFKDEDIIKKLKTKMKLFSNLEDNENFQKYLKLNSRVEHVRSFLIPVSSRKNKSVIKIEDKENVLSFLKGISNDIENITNEIAEIIKQEILDTKENIYKEICRFLNDYPSESLKKYSGDLYERALGDSALKIISKIKFPEPEDLFKKVNIYYKFYALTFEDFKDDELLEEFEKKGILSDNDMKSIVEIKSAFGIKK